MKKKLIAGIVVAGAIAASLSAYAANSSTMTVNGVSISCFHSRKAYNDSNPFTSDYVTATATAANTMESMSTTAKIYYALGSELKSAVNSEDVIDAKKCEAKATAEFMSSSYAGAGAYNASYGIYSDSTTTGNF